MANIPISMSDNNMVIELSDDEGEEAVSASAEGIAKVKEEYVDEHLNQNQQHQQSSGQGIVAIKTEDIHPTPVLSSLNAAIACALPSSTTSPEMFAPTNIEAPERRVEKDESVNVVSPASLTMVGIKRDPNGYDDETAVHDDRTSENKRLRQELESRRLDPCLEAKLLLTDFWSVNKDHIQFDEQAFMTNPLFHLNSFVRSEKKIKEGFSEFIREGIGTPGFLSLPNSLDIEKIADWTHKELREELTKMNHSDWGATATATWLKKATVGSFVIMRHCYPKCKFCPKRLFVDGSYIGPVYVIGIITKKVLPWSEEERRIADTITGAYNLCTVSSEKMGYINELKHNFCTVSWEKMGYINELKESTKKYLSKVVQPTLQQICENVEKRFDGGGTSDSIRRDLWKCAREKISSEQFPDQFQHKEIQDPDISSPNSNNYHSLGDEVKATHTRE
jgi:hypothetical protein